MPNDHRQPSAGLCVFPYLFCNCPKATHSNPWQPPANPQPTTGQPATNHRDTPQKHPLSTPRHTRDTPTKNPKTIISIHRDHLAIVIILQYPVKVYCDDFITFFDIGAFLFHLVVYNDLVIVSKGVTARHPAKRRDTSPHSVLANWLRGNQPRSLYPLDGVKVPASFDDVQRDTP